MPDAVIRDVVPSDVAQLLALNNRYAAEVNALTLDELTGAIRVAAAARTLATRQAFTLAYDERTPAQGPNHAWFLARNAPFLYIDRIVIASSEQGRGIGRQLYQDLLARGGDRPLCCEVNVEPLNAPSLAFHERLGFRARGEATDPRNGKRVRYLTLERVASSSR